MIIVNDEVIEINKINLDSGFEFGHGLFETIDIKNSKAIFLEEHLERLNQGLKELNINKSISYKEAMEAINKLSITEGALKTIVSNDNTIFKGRENPYNEESYNSGFSIKKSDVLRNETSKMTYMKSICYNDNIIELNEAKAQGFQEVFFENTKGYICEGSLSNIFFVKNDIIYTPSLKCGLLNGIIRQWIMRNFHVEEGFFTKEDLYTCDEIFLTNSLMGVMKVHKIDDINLENHDVSDKIYKIYKETIKVLKGDNNEEIKCLDKR